MPQQESEIWDEFLKGTIRLPAINWDVDIGETPTSTKGLQRAKRRAEALNRLYDSDKAQPSHSVWFTQQHPYCLPLVKAMARVIGAERQLGQTDGANPSDLADLQTIRAVVSLSLQSNQRRKLMPKALGKNINRYIELLIGHKKRIQQRRHGLLKRRTESKQSP